MTTTLVTGATGQVGRRFVPRLLQWTAPGDTVRVLVRDPDQAGRFAALGAEAVVGDLCDPDDRAKALAGVDAVANVAAAFRDVPDERAWAVNRDAAVALGRQALDAGVSRFVQTSTNLVYGAGRGRPAREGDPLLTGGDLVYPVSKAQADAGLLALHAEHGLPLVIVRLAYVYGEGDPHLRAAVPRAAEWAAHRRLPVVHHADVAQALYRALVVPGVEGRAFNATDDAAVSAFDVYRLAGLALDEAAAADRTVPDPWFGFTDNLSLREELGWRPLYPSVWSARDAGAL
jgi:nucleoside-diphosphate-sugar epimerase